MNQWTTRQKKLAWLGAILALLVPIIGLGMPADKTEGSGGRVAQLRAEFDLGETDLGQIDPNSAAMNLALLGLRGVAVNLMWQDLEQYKKTKDWARMQSTTDTIVKLQPHFEAVWEFCGHNLAWNTSVEWDSVPDRYHWVKEGGKFYQRGVLRNQKSTQLTYFVGKVYQMKIGQADEKRYFRYFFTIKDPAEKFNGLPDPDFNSQADSGNPLHDNYMEAKRWYTVAVEKEREKAQRVLDRTLFRGSPARSQFDFAAGLYEDGLRLLVGTRPEDTLRFEDVDTPMLDRWESACRDAWSEALDDWTKKYGQEEFTIYDPEGTQLVIRLEMSAEDIEKTAKSDLYRVKLQKAVAAYQDMGNYRYWRTRANCESEPEMVTAHREFFEAGEHYRRQNLRKALELITSAMSRFDKMISKPEYADLKEEDDLIEECLMAVRMFENITMLQGDPIPADFPLKRLRDEYPQMWQSVISIVFDKRFLLL